MHFFVTYTFNKINRLSSQSLIGLFVSALPIFPGSLPPSIFSACELNFRVRDGNGWTLTAINTDCYILTDLSVKIKSFMHFYL